MSLYKKHKVSKPPSLLRGLFVIILLTISLILITAVSIIKYDVEQLVATRTSEYAHSIAKIAANTSVKSLLANNKEQLENLARSVTEDPYIKSATVFAEDGQVFAQYPKENTPQFSASPNNKEKIQFTPAVDATNTNIEIQKKTLSYLESKNNRPYLEPIISEGATIGWFKVLINRSELENSFRYALSRSKNIILILTLFLLTLLFIIILRFETKVKTLVSLNHRLLQINSPSLPINNKDWMDKIRAISETQFYKLAENKRLPTKEKSWITSKRSNDSIFCYCQFAMQEQEDDQTAECLTLAEQYIQSAIQTHGLHSQGDILSGCLIPILGYSDKNEAIVEVLGLIHLIKELLASLNLPIKMRAFIGIGSLLVLENDRAEISGVSLSNRLADKINKLSPQTSYGDVLCINIEIDELTQLGQFKKLENIHDIQAFKLTNVSKPLQLQVNSPTEVHKGKYISRLTGNFKKNCYVLSNKQNVHFTLAKPSTKVTLYP